MLILLINTDEYRLTSKNEEQLKKELLGRYADSDVIEIIDAAGKVYDTLRLDDLFNTK